MALEDRGPGGACGSDDTAIPYNQALMRRQARIPLEQRRLQNGLWVVVSEDHSHPLVSVQVWYRVGSRNEHEGITGVSHLLEHMMFKGTERLGPEEFSQIVQRMGGVDNAFTSFNMTAYWSEVPSRHLETLLQMEADRMANAVFREFEEEKAVVLEERRLSENSPWDAFFDTFQATALQAHPYRNPIIGWRSDVERLTLEDVQRHYRTYYAPSNALLLVVGDVRPEEVFALAEKHFGPIHRPVQVPEVRTQEPPQQGERRFRLYRPGPLTLVGVGYHIPRYRDPAFPAVHLLSEVLVSGRSARLYRQLVMEAGVASSVGLWTDWISIDPFIVVFYAVVQPGTPPEEVERRMIQEIEGMGSERPVSQAELDRVRNRVVLAFYHGQQTMAGKGMLIGEFAIVEDPEAVNRYLDRLEAVTPEQAQQVAQRYFRERNRTVGYLLEGTP